MTSVLARHRDDHPALFHGPCCLDHTHDAYRLARAVAEEVPPGQLLDIGCGAGGVAIPVLQARPDVRVTGVELSRDAAARARQRAASSGVVARMQVLAGDAFAIPLPRAPSVAANPPMLPAEPGFSFRSRAGGEELFWEKLVRVLARRAEVADVWLHLFDFQGVGGRFGNFPSVDELARTGGFEVSYPHRGWRACGPRSAITSALPTLRRLFPDARARLGDTEARFGELACAPQAPLLIPHSIVRLHRAPATSGGLL